MSFDWSPPEAGSPSAGSRGGSSIDITFRGLDGQAWMVNWTGGAWTSPYALGGVLHSSPGTVTRARTTNRIDIAAFMNEEVSANQFVPGMWWKQYQ